LRNTVRDEDWYTRKHNPRIVPGENQAGGKPDIWRNTLRKLYLTKVRTQGRKGHIRKRAKMVKKSKGATSGKLRIGWAQAMGDQGKGEV